MVATRVGGTPEAIEDGVNGLLVPPGDSSALANAIGYVLAHPPLAARLGRAARSIRHRTILDGAEVRATGQLYESLLEQRATS